MRLHHVLGRVLPGHRAIPRGIAACAAALVAMAAAPAAWAGGQAEFAARLTGTAPGTPSGLSFHLLLLRAGDPNAKPPPLRSVVVAGPAGLRFDNAAAPQCTASDAEIHLFGAGACPADSQLTVGSFTGITGFGPPLDPFVGDDHVFNGPGQLIEIITEHGNPSLSPAADRLAISGSTLTAHPPAVPGAPPDGQASVRSIDFQIPVRTSSGRALITTPPACSPSGQWTTNATFDFTDGSTAHASSDSPCAGGATPAAAPPRAAPPAPGPALAGRPVSHRTNRKHHRKRHHSKRHRRQHH